MDDEAPKKKRGWFWVGVTLLILSALLWLIEILGIFSGEDPVIAIGMGLFYTAIPIGLGIACLMQRSPPIERSPWGLGTLLYVSFFAGFAAAGIIAGINWRRMGYHNLMWPTIIGAIILFVILVLLLPETTTNSIANFISLAAAWGLWLWQRNFYHAWTTLHTEAPKAGWKIPVTVIMVTLAFLIGALLGVGF